MENKELEYRMYFFVPYNISPIQQSIQAGHCVEEYSDQYFNTVLYRKYRKDKTWIILNGGTTNSKRDLDGISLGSLNQIGDSLLEKEIPFAYFEEPDLNDALTAVCFIADERVWNYDDYPNLNEYVFDSLMFPNPELRVKLAMMTEDKIKIGYYDTYIEWVESMGGEKNIFLRELIKGKKKA